MSGRVIVIGDVMLDEYVYGDVTRISPEAATPILNVTQTKRMIGGAGNVARGIAALDTPCDFITVANAADDAGRLVMTGLQMDHNLVPYIQVEAKRPTTVKTRYVSTQHSSHLLRIDREDAKPIPFCTQTKIVDTVRHLLGDAMVVILSDYCKGVITPDVARNIIAMARRAGKIVIVDSKRTDLEPFEGASIVKLNESELRAQKTDALSVCLAHRFDHVVITEGERGCTLWSNAQSHGVHIDGKLVRVRDVSGAGDTFVAALASSLTQRCDLIAALKVATQAAAVAVGKPGTAVVTTAELKGGKITTDKDWTLVDQRVREWRGLRVGLANGCFDLLHTGHLHLLQTAREHCDRLVVALNSDASVKRYKGLDRPAQTQDERAAVLSHLDYVDLVVIFDGDDPTEVCERIRPHTMFKGSDWNPRDIKGKQYATNLHMIERGPEGPTTTQTIERIRASQQPPIVPGADTYDMLAGEWCEQCQGPCARRPRHGESGL